MESTDYDFVDTIHERFICSICTKVMRDPHLVVCCGQKYCASCLLNWLKTQPIPTCPHCRATDKGDRPFQHVIERGMKSEIESFHIKCSNQIKNCKWVGEVRALDGHLKSDQGCAFHVVECPKNCLTGKKRTKLLRKNLPDHLSHRCVLRKVKCEHCGHTTTAKDHSSHLLTCKMFPVQCPNNCGETGLVRKQLNTHRQTCKFELISCEYANVGCEEKVRRRDIPQHMILSQGQHLEMMKGANKRLQEVVEDMKLNIQEMAQRECVVKHELKLAELSHGASSLTQEDWLDSIKTQLEIPRYISNKQLYFRMLHFRKIREGQTVWFSPKFQLYGYIMYMHVKCHDQPNMLSLELWLGKVEHQPTTIPVNTRISIRVKQPTSKRTQLSNSPMQNPPLFQQPVSALTHYYYNPPSGHSSPVFQSSAHKSISVYFDFRSSAPSVQNVGSDKLLHNWSINISCSWEELYVEDDSLIWTVSTENLHGLVF